MDHTRFNIAAFGDVAMLRSPSQKLFLDPWKKADLHFANLEAPLTEDGVPAAKLIRLKSPVQAAEWLAELGCDAVSLANNHIMDWGVPGLDSTLGSLDRAGVHYAGAGANLDAAAKHTLLSARGWRIAFFSWACTVPPGFQARTDRPGLASIRVRTSYAADTATIDEQPGTPPWVHTEALDQDVERLVAAIHRARQEADLVVLALHWGVPPQWQSWFQGPLAEYQVPLGRRLVEAGVDLILGSHAHTVYGIEAVAREGRPDGLICYSLGNYVFHPLAEPRGLELDSAILPYRAEEKLENSQTYVAQFSVTPTAAGKLQISQVRLVPAFMDKRGEARIPTAEQARAICERVAQFSKWRGTDVEIAKSIVTWKSHANT